MAARATGRIPGGGTGGDRTSDRALGRHDRPRSASIAGDEEVLTKFNQNPPTVYGFGHVAYLEHVIDAILNGKPSLVDGLEGRRSLELVTAIYESMATGAPVTMRFRAQRSLLGRGS